MVMSRQYRRFCITAHVMCSVGFLGAVLTFFALAAFGFWSTDVRSLRASYIAMELITRFVILPSCLLSLLTGIVQAIGTPWGLMRHYWVVTKLLLTCACTIALLLHTRPIQRMAQMAMQGSSVLPTSAKLQLLVASGAAVLALTLTTFLSVYKPEGLTPRGWRLRYRPSIAAAEGLADD